jgi:periplasmic divalent cation tolerance protein
MSRYVVGYVTCSSRSEARKLARAVLSAKHAACVNILSGVESHYWWQGKLDRADEFLLMIKTTRDQTKAIVETIKAKHSYEVPEIIFTPITGERRYLKWIASSVVALVLATTGWADGFDALVKQLGSTNAGGCGVEDCPARRVARGETISVDARIRQSRTPADGGGWFAAG